jgi:hypothetical protein
MRYRDRERNRDGRANRDTRNNRDGRDGRDRRDERGGQGQERNDRRNRFRRRHRGFPRRQREERKDGPPCPICERPIQELSNAINHSETERPAHFDCIMKKIEETEGGLGANEKICYLGKGSFGILRFQKMGGNIPFIIRKRIQYENIDETPEWRKNLDRYNPKPKLTTPPPGDVS